MGELWGLGVGGGGNRGLEGEGGGGEHTPPPTIPSPHGPFSSSPHSILGRPGGQT